MTRKILHTSLLSLLLVATSKAGTLPEDYVNKVADAIYKAEGGRKARVPYGILSVKVADEAEARRVCLNTIRNNYRRWEKAGKPGLFLDYLGNVYCPASADPVGNKNWRANVKRLTTQ
jgi:hypothetical protein